MKVIVSSTGPDLTSQLDPRFGRCSWLVVVDTETREATALENEAAAGAGGAGVGAARAVVKTDAEVVLTRQVGPNAIQALQELGVAVHTVQNGTVGEAVEAFVNGTTEEINRPNVASHTGMGMGAPVAPPADRTAATPRGGGAGGGRGNRGGAGRGRGRGGGRR